MREVEFRLTFAFWQVAELHAKLCY